MIEIKHINISQELTPFNWVSGTVFYKSDYSDLSEPYLSLVKKAEILKAECRSSRKAK